MREIKFRAWDGEKMHLFPLKGVVGELMPITFDGVHYRIIFLNGLSEPIELMQYTGLKDKNDKEIYEGDIVRTDGGRICCVKWVSEDDGYDYTGWFFDGLLDYSGNVKHMEAIGNIFENSGLLNP